MGEWKVASSGWGPSATTIRPKRSYLHFVVLFLFVQARSVGASLEVPPGCLQDFRVCRIPSGRPLAP